MSASGCQKEFAKYGTGRKNNPYREEQATAGAGGRGNKISEVVAS